MAAPERLEVGAVRQRDLDLHEHVPGSGLRIRNFLEAQVAGAVEDQGPHSVKTTFTASPRR